MQVGFRPSDCMAFNLSQVLRVSNKQKKLNMAFPYKVTCHTVSPFFDGRNGPQSFSKASTLISVVHLCSGEESGYVLWRGNTNMSTWTLKSFVIHPLKLILEPKNHPIEKGDHLNQTSVFEFHLEIPGLYS